MTRADGASQDSKPTDAGLVCPVCDYNLTGTTGDRCPECGQEFDVGELLTWRDGGLMPATPWDRIGGWPGFWRTWLMGLVAPGKLAARFPAGYSTRAAVEYSTTCYVAAFALLPIVGILGGWGAYPSSGGDLICLAVAFTLVVVPAAWLCEAILARFLGAVAMPAFCADPPRFWRGLAHYTSGFLIVTTGGMGFACVAVSGARPSYPDTAIATGLVGLGSFIWWVIAWWTMLRRRVAPGRPLWPGYAAVIVAPIAAAAP